MHVQDGTTNPATRCGNHGFQQLRKVNSRLRTIKKKKINQANVHLRNIASSKLGVIYDFSRAKIVI